MQQDSLENWYTAAKAAEVLGKKSKRHVTAGYLRQLAHLGKITTKRLGNRMTLYLKTEVDAYVVESRGVKSGRAMTARHQDKQ